MAYSLFNSIKNCVDECNNNNKSLPQLPKFKK